jgi:protein gp37
VVLNETALEAPMRRKKPTVYFVNSMSDLFHESVSRETLDRIYGVMAACPQHVFQVLTKRPERMRAYLSGTMDGQKSLATGTRGARGKEGEMGPSFDAIGSVGRTATSGLGSLEVRGNVGVWLAPVPEFCGVKGVWTSKVVWPPANVWHGVSVEDQAAADARVPVLLDTPSAVRFLSCEPLLGPVDLEMVCLVKKKPESIRAGIHINALGGHYQESGRPYIGEWDIEQPMPVREPRKLDWVIVGGESGHGARAMHPEWVRGIRDACVGAGVPFFFKQWGEWVPAGQVDLKHGIEKGPCTQVILRAAGEKHSAARFWRVGKAKAGRELDGREWSEMPVVGG